MTTVQKAPPIQSSPCLECGYDLRGHDDSDRCPECGMDVASSRQDRQLLHADRAWLTTLSRGCACIVLAVIVLLAAIGLQLLILGLGLMGNHRAAVAVSPFIAVLGILCMLVGFFIISTPEPLFSQHERELSARKITRGGPLLAICLLISASLMRFSIMTFINLVLIHILLLVSALAALTLLHQLAERTSDTRKLMTLARRWHAIVAISGVITATLLGSALFLNSAACMQFAVWSSVVFVVLLIRSMCLFEHLRTAVDDTLGRQVAPLRDAS